MIAEHHMNGDRMKRARRRLQRRWKVAITPALSTSKMGTSGGTLVLASSALVAHSSFFGLDGQRLQCDNWTATVVRMKGYDVLFISVYMQTGVGPQGTNLHRMAQIAALVNTMAIEFVIAGDWNMTPDELRTSDFDQCISGTIVEPGDAEFTCAQGGRTIDYCIVSRSLVGSFQLKVDKGAPWSPHVGLVGRLQAQHKEKWIIAQEKAAELR